MSAKRRVGYTLLGLLFSILPPLLATLSYFPLFRSAGREALLSGAALLLLPLCALPLFRLIVRRLASPSVWQIWLLSFLLFFLLSRIARQMTVVSFFGFLGNLVGSFFFRKGASANEKHEEL